MFETADPIKKKKVRWYTCWLTIGLCFTRSKRWDYVRTWREWPNYCKFTADRALHYTVLCSQYNIKLLFMVSCWLLM